MPDTLLNPLALSTGWTLTDRQEGPAVTMLEFHRGGSMGLRVSAFGRTFEEALNMGRERMKSYDEHDWQRMAD